MGSSASRRPDPPRSAEAHATRDRDDAVALAELAKELREMRREIQLLGRQVETLNARVPLGHQLLERLVSHRLVLTPQHAPRPLRIPSWYQRIELAAPPPISIVTPSYNQGSFVERTIRSVLDQGYPRLEYVVQDGGSDDESVSIIRRYAARLTHWESGADGGQAAAINRGFRHTSGDLMAYLNSDDQLLPGTLHYVADYFTRHPHVDVVYGHRVLINEEDEEVGRWILPPHDDAMLRWADYVPQETLFWRRRVWDKVGGFIDEGLHFAIDWDLLLRLQEVGARMVRLPRFLGAFRIHAAQKTSSQLDVGHAEVKTLRRRCHGRTVHDHELRLALRGYLWRQVLLHHLYRVGLLRY